MNAEISQKHDNMHLLERIMCKNSYMMMKMNASTTSYHFPKW